MSSGAKAKIVNSFNSFVKKLNIGTNEEEYYVSTPDEINEKLKQLTDLYNTRIQQDVPPMSDLLMNEPNIASQLNHLISIIPESQEKEQVQQTQKNQNETNNINIPMEIPMKIPMKINDSSIQKGGGPIQVKNRKMIYMKVKQIVITLFEKCNNFLVDSVNSNNAKDPVTNTLINTDIIISDASNLTILLTAIPSRYEITSFCKRLLFEVDDEQDNYEDIGKEGILISLQNLATQFTSDDINQDDDLTPLTLKQMLDNLGLTEIKWLMYMLSVNTTNLQLNTVQSQLLCDEIGLELIPDNIKQIYETTINNQIISIFCFTILYRIYNGIKSSWNNNSIYQDFIYINYNKIFTTLNAQPINAKIPLNGLSLISSEMFLRGVVTGTVISSSTSPGASLASINSGNLPFLLNNVFQQILPLFHIPVNPSRALTRIYTSRTTSSSTISSSSSSSPITSILGTRKNSSSNSNITKKSRNSGGKRNRTRKIKKQKKIRNTYKNKKQKQIRNTYKNKKQKQYKK